MSRFRNGDTIVQVRLEKIISMGKVISDVFSVEKIDHYHVQWDWIDPQFLNDSYEVILPSVICDLRNAKYSYEKLVD
jgi:hypothetical protein